MKTKRKITPSKKSAKSKINKNSSFSELLEKHPELAHTLSEEGMHCAGCPFAARESLEQGALAHGINPEKLVKKLNKKVKKK